MEYKTILISVSKRFAVVEQINFVVYFFVEGKVYYLSELYFPLLEKLECCARNIDIFDAMVSFRSVTCMWTVHMLLWVDFCMLSVKDSWCMGWAPVFM